MFSEFMVEGIPAPIFWLFVGTAIIIQGISKSGFAGGAGVLALPLMMLVMPPHLVTATLLPLLILCDMNAIYHHRTNRIWKHIMAIYLPSLIGILLGAAVWWHIGSEGIEGYERPIKAFVGCIAIVFALYIFAKETALHWVAQYKPGPKVGALAGMTAGFTSTIAHAAGPIVSLYMFAQDMGKTVFVGTVAWTFTLINLTKLPFYVGVGLVDTSVLSFDLVLIPLIPIGSFLGRWMHHRVSERLFNRVILVFTLIAATQLVLDFNIILWVLRQMV